MQLQAAEAMRRTEEMAAKTGKSTAARANSSNRRAKAAAFAASAMMRRRLHLTFLRERILCSPRRGDPSSCITACCSRTSWLLTCSDNWGSSDESSAVLSLLLLQRSSTAERHWPTHSVPTHLRSPHFSSFRLSAPVCAAAQQHSVTWTRQSSAECSCG